MKKKFLMMAVGMVFCCGLVTAVFSNRAFADCIETNLFGCVDDDGSGSAIFQVLYTILQVLTYGVGIGGVVGIVVSGIQYLTARDNEAQAAKARRRILEVVIGLIVYAVMYVVLNFLLIPGGIK